LKKYLITGKKERKKMNEEEKKYKIVAHCQEKIPMKEKFSMKEFGFTLEKTYNKEPEWGIEEAKLYTRIDKIMGIIKREIKEKETEEG